MEPISQYVDHVLRPLVESLPSYLKDIADFFKQLSDSNIDDNEEAEFDCFFVYDGCGLIIYEHSA